MYFPTTRVLTVLELLQSRQMISGRELSERLEVDQRTVRRYIVMLQDMGIPVEGTRGRYGTYRLRPGFRLPPLMLRDDEVMAVTLGLLVARKMGLSLTTPAAESALAKIERVLPAALREQTQALQSSLSVEVMPLPAALPKAEIVVTLSSASARNRRVWLRYRSYRDAETEREFDPYGLVYRMGYWYAVGYCHLRSELRTLRLDRLVCVEEREQSFQSPANFDCLDFVVHSIQKAPGAWYIEVLLESSYEDAQRYFPAAMAVLEQCPDGILMHCYVEHLSWVAHLLVTLRCPFVVRQPVELKAEIRKAVQHVLEQIERS